MQPSHSVPGGCPFAVLSGEVVFTAHLVRLTKGGWYVCSHYVLCVLEFAIHACV